MKNLRKCIRTHTRTYDVIDIFIIKQQQKNMQDKISLIEHAGNHKNLYNDRVY